MDTETHRLIEAIHQTPFKIVLVATGGGTSAAGQLLSVPGGSRTVLEALIPYAETAFVEFMGYVPEQFCSAETSRTMASEAHERARRLAPEEPVIGVACTASLATDRPKRGDHRIHVTTQSDERAATYSLTLRKGHRGRAEEEQIATTMILNGLATACGLPRFLRGTLEPDEVVETQIDELGSLASLFWGNVDVLCVEIDGRIRTTGPKPAALLSGAFNPLHTGHLQLAEVATRHLGKDVAFELSILNADKPPLPSADIRHRIEQFAWKNRVWLTRAPIFAQKASLFPGAVFVVGADTAERILAPRYYPDGECGLTEALEHIQRQGCHFLVAGRPDQSGNFVALEHLPVPASRRDIFTAIPESDFRMSISSTALRERAKAAVH